MNRLKTTLFLLLLIATFGLLISCEANKEIAIQVVDEKTSQPIDSVIVKVNAGYKHNYNLSTAKGFTNANGEFNTQLMIGCSFGCYDILLELSKEEYETKKCFNITNGLIKLTPLNNDHENK